MRFFRGSGRDGPTSALRHVVVLNWRDRWHPEGGGSELYVQQIVERLRDAGTRVTWMTATYPGSANDEVIDGIRYVRRGGHVTVYLWTAWLLVTGRLGRADAILEVQNGMPFLASLFTRTPVTVLVHHVHREQWSVVGPLLARVGWLMESRVAVAANRGVPYVAVSDVTKHELIDLGVQADDITLAHNGVPPVPAYVDRGKAAEPTLVVLSRLVPHKQIHHIIRALPGLLVEFPTLRLRVMGSGWWADHLVELTASLGLQSRVDFLGHVTDLEKFEELASAWVHVLPSVKEGWGLSIVEAAHAGTPSVAYASAGGVAESILDGVTGLLAHDEADLSTKIGALLRDPEINSEMGAKARLRSSEFTWEVAAERITTSLLTRRH